MVAVISQAHDKNELIWIFSPSNGFVLNIFILRFAFHSVLGTQHSGLLFPSPPLSSPIRYNESMAKEFTPEQQIWVTTREGAEVTGYNSQYLEKLAKKNWRLPENERDIKIRNRSRRYELWLPDLLTYIEEIGYGPYPKR